MGAAVYKVHGDGKDDHEKGAIIMSSPHDGCCQSTSFDWRDGKGDRNIEALRRGKMAEGKSGKGTRAEE